MRPLIFETLATGIVAFVLTFLSIPPLMRKLRAAGIVGIDVHKLSHPEIPEMGGLAILLGFGGSMLAAMFLLPEYQVVFASVLLSVLVAGAVGVVDDLRGLGPKEKPLLLILAGLPILALGVYNPFLRLPIVGPTRLFFVYPLLVLIAVSVVANAVNMLDVYNGSMPATCIPVTVVLFTASLLSGDSAGAAMSLGLMSILIAFYWYNRFPAKLFSGNVGSLAVGAALVGIAIGARLEVVALVAMMPHIMNAFHILKSVGGIMEKGQMGARPTVLLEDESLAVNLKAGAPLTLAGLVLAKGPMTESQTVKVFAALAVYSGILALVTYFTIPLG
ncbi:MAG: hypothetical protein ACE5II_05795 [Anaerolineae bacterium]